MRVWSALSVTMCLAAAGTVSSQSRPAFEVASIKRNLSGEPAQSGVASRLGSIPGGGFRATNVTLATLIRYAYTPLMGKKVPEGDLVGGPAWIRRARFDVEAKPPASTPPAQIYGMVQTLLEERFGLMVDVGQLERDAYALLRARDDGRLGDGMIRRSQAECLEDRGDLGAALRALSAGSQDRKPVVAPSESSARVPPLLEPSPVPPDASRLMSTCATPAETANALSRVLRTVVVDNTGLDGQWEYTVTHSGLQPSQSTDVPMIHTALREQLGLKLENIRVDVDVLHVDAVRELIEN